MRQVLQVTFQALTKNSKLTPEFLNSLFVITFLQVAVFGHYYQHSQRPNFATVSYEAQDEALQMNQTYETVLKEVLPLLRIYFTDSPKQFSSEILRVINKINMSNANLFNILKNKENILLIEDFIRTIAGEELTLKVLPLFSKEEVSFHAKNGNERYSIEPDFHNPELLSQSFQEGLALEALSISLEEEILPQIQVGHAIHSIEPDPINPDPLFVSSIKSQESSTQTVIGMVSEEKELKGRFIAPSPRDLEVSSLSKLNMNIALETSIKKLEEQEMKPSTYIGGIIELEKKLENVLSSACISACIIEDTSKNYMNNKTKPPFKLWNTYQVNSKDPQLRFWLSLLAPSHNVPEELQPLCAGAIETLLSDEFQSYVNVDWIDEDTDEIKKLRSRFFYALIDRVKWEDTRFGFFYRPNAVKNIHNVKENRFLYVYEFAERYKLVRCSDLVCTNDEEDDIN